jgi:hypothetical protein
MNSSKPIHQSNEREFIFFFFLLFSLILSFVFHFLGKMAACEASSSPRSCHLTRTGTMEDNELETTLPSTPNESIHEITPISWAKLLPLHEGLSRIDITNNEYLIGRSKDIPAEGRILEKRISSIHCKIIRNEDGVFLIDLR